MKFWLIYFVSVLTLTTISLIHPHLGYLSMVAFIFSVLLLWLLSYIRGYFYIKDKSSLNLELALLRIPILLITVPFMIITALESSFAVLLLLLAAMALLPLNMITAYKAQRANRLYKLKSTSHNKDIRNKSLTLSLTALVLSYVLIVLYIIVVAPI